MNTLMTSEGGNVTSGVKLALRGLLFTDEKGSPTGELAAEVPSTQNGGISADGKTITYKLRPNMTWHDGEAVTSADVQYTWQALMEPGHNVATRYGYDRIDAVDVNPFLLREAACESSNCSACGSRMSIWNGTWSWSAGGRGTRTGLRR